MIETAVVRKDENNNFLILFPDRHSQVDDTCPAFACLRATHHVQDFGSHSMCDVPRGLYPQNTKEVTQEEADQAVHDYRQHIFTTKVFNVKTVWKRK
jgi:hypothetical protein